MRTGRTKESHASRDRKGQLAFEGNIQDRERWRKGYTVHSHKGRKGKIDRERQSEKPLTYVHRGPEMRRGRTEIERDNVIERKIYTNKNAKEVE